MITDPNPNPGILIAEALKDLAGVAARLRPLLHQLSFDERVQLASRQTSQYPQSPDHSFLKSTKDFAFQLHQDGKMPVQVNSNLAAKLVPLLEVLNLLQASVEDTILLSGMGLLAENPGSRKDDHTTRKHKKGPEQRRSG